MTWTCFGSVRRECGETHATREAAEEHCAEDGRACGALPGNCYSDRSPHRTDCTMGAYGVSCSCPEGDDPEVDEVTGERARTPDEEAAHERAMERWARNYDDLDGAPEGEDDR